MSAPRPRVLLVVNSLGYGGTERMIERLVLALEARGEVRYTVASLEGPGPIGARLKAAGVDVRAFHLSGGALRQILGGRRALRRLLRSERFDLVHSFLYRSHSACRLARLGASAALPLISSERCLGDNRGWAIRAANRWTGAMSDRILAVSAAVAETVVRRDRVPEEKVVVVPNGIEEAEADPRRRARLRRVLGLAGTDALLLYLGRLHPEKGPDLLLDALDLLRRRLPSGWRAAIVGDGPLRDVLARDLRGRRLGDRVVMPGARRRVEPWLDAADLLVLPSREEGMPVAALEAMMRGRPVVGTAIGGTPEVVADGRTGRLVRPGDAAGLAEALAQLVADPELRRTLGTEAAADARRRFALPRMAEATLHEYRRLLVPASAPSGAMAAARID
ncbi:MAG TPA: glycosyltransferase family 4 protein [Candidatus Polarisedimenticolia bacterium]|nr:glycosyltransferase family 4 protein [Candidatus Polarisedimenticolia bacterium]